MSLLLWQVIRAGGGGGGGGGGGSRLLLARNNKSRGATMINLLLPTDDKSRVASFATSQSPSSLSQPAPKPSPGGPPYRRVVVPPKTPPKPPPKPSPGGPSYRRRAEVSPPQPAPAPAPPEAPAAAPPKPSPGGRPFIHPPNTISRKNSEKREIGILNIDVLRSQSENLLELPIGTWNEKQWKDCVSLIHQWTIAAEELDHIQRRRQQRDSRSSIAADDANAAAAGIRTANTGESVIVSFSLLERLLLEYKTASSSSNHTLSLAQKLLQTNLLNACVYNWNKCWRSLHLTGTNSTTTATMNNQNKGDNNNGNKLKEETVAMEVEDAQNRANILLSYTPESILGRIDGYENRTAKDRLLLPDQFTYETIVAAAAASSRRRGARTSNTTTSSFHHGIARKVLDKMTATTMTTTLEEDATMQPSAPPAEMMRIDRMFYVKLIRLYARNGIGEEAEAVLEHMYEFYVQTGNKEYMPTTREFQQVLVAWSEIPADYELSGSSSSSSAQGEEEEEATELEGRSSSDNNDISKSNLKYASDRSLAILKRMDKLSEQDGGKLHGVVNPDGACYNVVLRCLWRWLASEVILDNKDSNVAELEHVGELAEDLLRDLKYRHQNGGGRSVQPGVGLYNKVLLIWSLLGNATRAEGILQEMYEDYRDNRNHRAKPNDYSFDLVLTAWWNQLKYEYVSNDVRRSKNSKEASSAGAERAEAIFRRMQEVASDHSLGGVKPTERSWLTVIHCWAETRWKEAGERALAILEEAKAVEEETGEQILNRIHYGAVIHAFANAGNAQGAEKVMAQWHRQYQEEGNNACKPSAQTISILINAWAKSDDPKAAERADTLLQEMKRLYQEGILDAPPQTITYSSVLQCYAKSSLPGAAERAEALLEEMQRASRDGVDQVRPNVIAYRNLLHGMALRGEVEKTEALVEHMFEDYRRGNIEAKPNTRSMNLVLTALSNSNLSDAGTRAIAHLKRMENLYEMGKLVHPPDVVSYTLAVKCISEAAYEGNRELAFDQAENLLQKMELRASKGEVFMAPNTMTYSTIIQIYGRCGRPEKAEAMLRRMYKQYTEGNTNAAPNARTFTSVLQAWSRSGSESSLESVLSILSWMKQLHDDGVLEEVRPNTYTYIGAIHCLLKLPKKEASFACQKTADLLGEMEKLAEEGVSDDELVPNLYCYNEVLRVFSRFGEGTKAQELIARMYQKFESGKLSEKPNALSWQLVLEAWSRSKDPSAPSRVATILKRIDELSENGTLEERPHASNYFVLMDSFLQSRHRGLREHIVPFLEEVDSLTLSGEQQQVKSTRLQTKVIRALCKLKDDDMLLRAEKILHRMINNGRSSSRRNEDDVRASYDDLIEAWSKSRDHQAKIHAGRLQQELNELDTSAWEG